jgi:hypothetical protein
MRPCSIRLSAQYCYLLAAPLRTNGKVRSFHRSSQYAGTYGRSSVTLPCVHSMDVAADRPWYKYGLALFPCTSFHPKLPDVTIPTRHLQEILIVS